MFYATGGQIAGKGVNYLYAGDIGTPPKTWPYAIKIPLNAQADLSHLLRTASDYER
jgi:hypothetical protein